MIRHIIMFKLKEYTNEEEKVNQITTLIKSFSELKNTIDVCVEFDVIANEGNNPAAYDIVINSSFRTWRDLETYSKHPEHQRAILENKVIKKEKAVIDYEY